MLVHILSGLFNPASWSGLEALPWAAAAAIIVAVVGYFSSKDKTATALVAGIGGLVCFWVLKFISYHSTPALTGVFDGYTVFIVVLLLTVAIFAGLCLLFGDDEMTSSRSAKPAISACLSSSILLIVVVIVYILAHTMYFDGAGAKKLAHLGNIVTASKSDTIPNTDPNAIVMVTQSMAAFEGQNVIGSAGNNLGSRYQTSTGDYVLQSIDGHLYYVAPLDLRSWHEQQNYLTSKAYDTPGYIKVDAENPNASPQILLGYHIHYSTDAMWDYNLNRHLYTNGYSGGNLVNPTFEVNDSGRPYWTVTYTQLAVRGSKGDVIKKVLIVDAQTGKISAYNPNDVPGWVDRVVSSDMVNSYAGWWGRYLNAGIVNQSGANEMQTAGSPELVYDQQASSVWLVPMTSSNGNDSSSTGVIIYSTHKAQGTFYPGLSGLTVGSQVNQTFYNISSNKVSQYQVQSVQLYEIDGAPTYVAIYGQQQCNDNGYCTVSFAGIGMLDARHANINNVIFATNKANALTNYANWLATEGNSSGNISQTAQTESVTGVVERIGSTVVGSESTYFVLLRGNSHLYSVTLAADPALPTVDPGDKVTMTYSDNGQTTVSVTTLVDDTTGH